MAHRLRLKTFGAVIGLIPEDRLRSTPAACGDTLWAVASAEVFLLFRRVGTRSGRDPHASSSACSW
jgi:hypothetical protein